MARQWQGWGDLVEWMEGRTLKALQMRLRGSNRLEKPSPKGRSGAVECRLQRASREAQMPPDARRGETRSADLKGRWRGHGRQEPGAGCCDPTGMEQELFELKKLSEKGEGMEEVAWGHSVN